MNPTQTKKGFTIIEVVLVLAIAGLIFLMVFVALPALQSGQRDNARRNDASLIATSITNYQSANRGNNPTVAQIRTALGGTAATLPNLSNNTNLLNVVTPPASGITTIADDETAVVMYGRKCASAEPNGRVTTTAGNSRQFAVAVRLEGNGGQAFCQDS